MTITAKTKRGGWTYADYCRIPADLKRHEIIDGRHFVNPAPSPRHQSVAGRVYAELLHAVEKAGRGRVFVSPIDVHLAPGTVVQPDVALLRAKNTSLIGEAKITGVPDLLVEVFSPSNRAYDARVKRDRYERAGVRELWLVDPVACTVEQLVLRRGAYVPVTIARDTITLRTLRGITIDLREVWF